MAQKAELDFSVVEEIDEAKSIILFLGEATRTMLNHAETEGFASKTPYGLHLTFLDLYHRIETVEEILRDHIKANKKPQSERSEALESDIQPPATLPEAPGRQSVA